MGEPDITNQPRVASFPPIYAADSQVLILGSMPSVASLEKQQYYGHPRNALWPILCDVLGEAYKSQYDLRVNMLIRHKLAIWDVAESCVRPGSSDSAMRDIQANDIAGLFALSPYIRAVCLNGNTAARLFRKHFTAPQGVDLLFMPSTSPAYTLPYEKKLEQWMHIRDYLSEFQSGANT